MRTKTLLLAAAALAAGLFNSQAQTPVYSQNIVGYANVVTAGNGGTYYLLATPFNIGVSNGANEVFGLAANPNALPTGTEILTWNVGSQSYSIAFYDSSTTPPWWDSANENFNVPTPSLPVGQGFFLLPQSSITNTFAGTVAVNVGSSNVVSLTGSGGTYYLLGSAVPYSGAVTATNGINLSSIPVGTEVLTWNVANQSYNIAFYDSSTTPPWWDSANENYNVPTPTNNVGGGFFVLPQSGFTWTNSLPSN
jgi:hypothetical protein